MQLPLNYTAYRFCNHEIYEQFQMIAIIRCPLILCREKALRRSPRKVQSPSNLHLTVTLGLLDCIVTVVDVIYPTHYLPPSLVTFHISQSHIYTLLYHLSQTIIIIVQSLVLHLPAYCLFTITISIVAQQALNTRNKNQGCPLA